MGPRNNRTYGQTDATFRWYSVWGVQNMSRMTLQRTTTLDLIDPKIPPLPRPPNTVYSLSDSPQRPRSGAAAEAGVS